MQINHGGFLYRTAYPFSHKPSRVGICVLWWRFVFVGLWRVVGSIGLWLIYGIFMAGVSVVLCGIGLPLIGRRIRYVPGNDHPFIKFNIIAPRLFTISLFNSYTNEPMNLPTIAGEPLRPIYPLTIIGIGIFLWYFGSRMVSAAVEFGSSARTEFMLNLSLDKVREIGYQGKEIFFSLLGLLVLVAIFKLVRAFLKSEAGVVFVAYLKAKVNKACPIVEVV